MFNQDTKGFQAARSRCAASGCSPARAGRRGGKGDRRLAGRGAARAPIDRDPARGQRAYFPKIAWTTRGKRESTVLVVLPGSSITTFTKGVREDEKEDRRGGHCAALPQLSVGPPRVHGEAAPVLEGPRALRPRRLQPSSSRCASAVPASVGSATLQQALPMAKTPRSIARQLTSPAARSAHGVRARPGLS